MKLLVLKFRFFFAVSVTIEPGRSLLTVPYHELLEKTNGIKVNFSRDFEGSNELNQSILCENTLSKGHVSGMT